VNVKEYIQSGIVESYVLGLATDAERLEFERNCADYPEIVTARDAFERSLEEQLLQDAVNPPAFVKEKVLEVIRPAITDNGAHYQVEETPVRRMNAWKWVAAASLILLAGAGIWGYTTNEKYNDLVAKQSAMEKQLQESTAQLQTLQQEAETIKKPMQVVSLKGTSVAPQAQTTVYWDTTGSAKDVYMVINNLPQAPSEMQYQLWALLDGQPIDLGVFDFDVRQKRLLVKMKNVQNAQAFAITLERRGRPNQEKPEGQIYVVGNL
jgi:anti-sigma-K factor RskA